MLMINWPRTILRAITTGILIFLFLTYFDDLYAFLREFVAASPSTRAQIVSLIIVLALSAYALRALIVVTVRTAIDIINKKLSEEPYGDLEIWVQIQPQKRHETLIDAIYRLRPAWNEANSSKYTGTIKQARRHEAAHAVVTWALGGTVLHIDAHRTRTVIPIPHPGAAAAAWFRLQVDLAGLTQDVINDSQAHGSNDDIDSAYRHATVLAAMGYRPDGYAGPITPSDLITYAIKTDKQLLAEHQEVVTAAAKALKKHDDKLDGVRLHRILDKAAKTTSTPVVEAAG